jgi:hypothetical protein
MTQPRGANPHVNDPPPRGANISGIVVTRVPARLQVTTAPATAVITLAQIMDAPIGWGRLVPSKCGATKPMMISESRT